MLLLVYVLVYQAINDHEIDEEAQQGQKDNNPEQDLVIEKAFFWSALLLRKRFLTAVFGPFAFLFAKLDEVTQFFDLGGRESTFRDWELGTV